MILIRRSLLVLVFSVLLLGQQMPPTRPDITGILPHGAQRGTDVEITIRGVHLEGTTALQFGTPKIKGEILRVEHNLVRARLHVAGDAEPGRHDLRLIAPHGSTIDWFEVGTRPDLSDKEPNNDRAHAQPIEFPVLINGTVTAGDYDFFKFTAREGQTLTFNISAKRFESPLDSVLNLFDEQGVQLAYVDDYYWFKDPHLVYQFKKAGTYFLKLFGTGESGSPTGAYRLTAGEMPQVDHVLPIGGQRGKTQEIRLVGSNLGTVESAVLGDGIAKAELVTAGDRSATLRITLPADMPLGMHQLHIGGATLPVPFIVSDLPQVVVSGDAARKKDDPYPVKLPVVASGVIDKPRAGDFFGFTVDEEQKVLLTVDGLRINNHLDAIVVLYNAAGERIAYQDDPVPTNSAKRPANVDPHLVVNLKPGRYTALVRDNAHRGDPSYAYRLTMKRAEPDYTAGIVGSDETLFRGKETVLTIRVRRLEGWNTPVEVWAENLPKGVTGPGKVVVPIEPTHFLGTCAEDNILDGTEVAYPLKVEAETPIALHKITFRARGVMEGRTVEHQVLPNYWWQGGRIWGPVEKVTELYASIYDAPKLVLDVPDRLPAPAGKGVIKVVVTRLDGGSEPMELRASNPPPGVTVESVTLPPSGTLADLKVTTPTSGAVTIVLEGISAGNVLGKSHPIVIDPAARAGGRQVDPDEN